MARILVVAPNWIGDALMAQALLSRLRATRGSCRLDVLAPSWVAPVARRMAEVDEVIEVNLRHGALQPLARWQLGRALRSHGYEEAVVLPNSWKSALIPFIAGIPRRIGYTGEMRYGLLNVMFTARQDREPMAQHYARLAGTPGFEPEKPLPLPSLLIDRENVNATADRFRIPGPYAVICPGAEYGPAKRWPYFRELAEKLGREVVLLGAASDREAAKGIPGRNLIGQTTLDEAIDLIAGAAFVVSNDSGLMHVAAATGTPQVALFGSSSPEHTPPGSDLARVVWLKIECSPCYERVCPLGHFNCMNGLTVDRVLAEIGALQ